MFLKSLKLDNFRNFESVDLQFKAEPGIQIFLGQNAQGKTNLLESIFLLSFPRSFRVASPNDLIRFNQNYFTIEAEFLTQDDRELDLMFGYQKKPIRRTYKKNGSEVPLTEYLTNLQTVLFTPEDVEILNETPAERRRFIDTILSQIDREYFSALVHYTRILKQRNALLKRISLKRADVGELSYWNKELATLAKEIHIKRLELFEFFSQHLPKFYADISEQTENEIELVFKYSGHSRTEEFDSYEEIILELLNEDNRYEIEVGHTTVGPHRDDFLININGKSVSQFCSRGEKRSFMLVLKMIELEFLYQKSGNRPILLLDDVFSELDSKRRTQLLNLSSQYQTIISTVEKSYFAEFEGEIELYNFDNNKVLRYN
jgi:DNA replication and repair protein RecF